MNNVSLLGNLVRDVELRFGAGSGKAVATFTLAVARKFKKDETDFINCKAFGKTAEIMAQYLTKGSQIAVVGSVQTGSYEAKDGSRRYTTDIIVDSFDFCRGAKQASEKPKQQEDLFDVYFDEEIPF